MISAEFVPAWVPHILFLCGAHREPIGLDTACVTILTASHREVNAHMGRDGHVPDTDLGIQDVNFLQLVKCELGSMLEFCSCCAAFRSDEGISPGGRAEIKKASKQNVDTEQVARRVVAHMRRNAKTRTHYFELLTK